MRTRDYMTSTRVLRYCWYMSTTMLVDGASIVLTQANQQTSNPTHRFQYTDANHVCGGTVRSRRWRPTRGKDRSVNRGRRQNRPGRVAGLGLSLQPSRGALTPRRPREAMPGGERYPFSRPGVRGQPSALPGLRG